jgi:ADP-ribose pyrophosphatase
MSREPFTRLGREVLVDNRWHRYCRDRYVQADGSDGTYYYVDMAGSVCVLPLFDDGTTMLVRVRRYLLGCDLFEFPTGGLQPGDDPLAMAQAELREEAGLVAARWQALGTFAPYKGVSTELCHVFLARDLAAVAQDLEASERITPHRLQLAEAARLLAEQQPADGMSLAALALLDRFRSHGGGA